jgi:predicted cupin superfamily sugar epimerase
MAVHVIEPNGEYCVFKLGPGESYSCAVKAGSWFAAEAVLLDGAASGAGDASFLGEVWALVSCAVSPGFDYRDFEIARREDLARQFPRYRAIIERLTKV